MKALSVVFLLAASVSLTAAPIASVTGTCTLGGVAQSCASGQVVSDGTGSAEIFAGAGATGFGTSTITAYAMGTETRVSGPYGYASATATASLSFSGSVDEAGTVDILVDTCCGLPPSASAIITDLTLVAGPCGWTSDPWESYCHFTATLQAGAEFGVLLSATETSKTSGLSTDGTNGVTVVMTFYDSDGNPMPAYDPPPGMPFQSSAAIPEPGSWALMLVGVIALLRLRSWPRKDAASW